MKFARWDASPGIARFWWVLPTMAIAVVLYAGLQLFGQSPVVLQERVRQDFVTTATPLVTIRSQAGAITIRGADRQVVRVVGTRRVDGSDRAQAARAFNALETRTRGDTNSVEILSYLVRDIEGSAETTLDLEVPRRARLRIELASGPVTIEGVLGDMVVKALGGDIVVRLPAGRGFRLAGGGTLASEFPLAQGGGELLITRDAPPQQDLQLTALAHRVAIKRTVN